MVNGRLQEALAELNGLELEAERIGPHGGFRLRARTEKHPAIVC